MDHLGLEEELYEVQDLTMVAVREPQRPVRVSAEEISTLPSHVVTRTPFEHDRRLIIYLLLVTLCVATLLSLVAVLFDKANSEAAVAVLAPLTTLATAVVFFHFPGGMRDRTK